MKRWEHEPIIDAMQRHLDQHWTSSGSDGRPLRHLFGTIAWMGSTHFVTRTLKLVSAAHLLSAAMVQPVDPAELRMRKLSSLHKGAPAWTMNAQGRRIREAAPSLYDRCQYTLPR
jgi:hypothetical protein